MVDSTSKEDSEIGIKILTVSGCIDIAYPLAIISSRIFKVDNFVIIGTVEVKQFHIAGISTVFHILERYVDSASIAGIQRIALKVASIVSSRPRGRPTMGIIACVYFPVTRCLVPIVIPASTFETVGEQNYTRYCWFIELNLSKNVWNSYRKPGF